MRIKAFISFLLFALSAPAFCQQTATGLTDRAYFVPQCSTAARLSATLARLFPTDEEGRREGFSSSTKMLLENRHETTPTIVQLNTAFIVMEMLVKTRTSESRESLNEIVLTEAAATCMAAALNQ